MGEGREVWGIEALARPEPKKPRLRGPGPTRVRTIPKRKSSELRRQGEEVGPYRAAGPGPTQTDPNERCPSTAQRATDRAPTALTQCSPASKRRESGEAKAERRKAGGPGRGQRDRRQTEDGNRQGARHTTHAKRETRAGGKRREEGRKGGKGGRGREGVREGAVRPARRARQARGE